MPEPLTLPDESTTLNNDAASSTASKDQQQDAGTAASSPATKEPTSLDDVSAAFAAGAPENGEEDAASGQEQASEGGESAEGQVAEGDGSENAEDEKAAGAADGETDKSLTDPTVPPPFHEHPRWKEVLAERDGLKPLAEQARTLTTYMAQNNISGEDLQGMLEIGALMQSNPEEAYRRLQPILDGLGQLVGKALPADLEQQVAEGKLTPAVAQELAQVRAQNKMLQQRQQQTVQQHWQSSQQALVTAVADWAGTKSKTDIGFKQGTPLWEAVNDRLERISARTPPKTPQEAVRLAEQAYLDVKKWMTPAPAAKATVAKTKSLSSNGSSAQQQQKEPQTLDEVAMQATGLRWAVPKKGI